MKAAKKDPPAPADSGPLPYVFVNMAMTADGKIASANRAISTFGSQRDHEHLYELRATADAVMSGARTADLNPVTMGPGKDKLRRARLKRGLAEYNLRVVVSGSGTVDPAAEVFRHKFSPIIILTTERGMRRHGKELTKVADEVKTFGKTEIDFRAALQWLREKWKVERLLCEGGGELNGALILAGVVDELNLTICPKIIGGNNAPTIAGGDGWQTLALATALKLRKKKRAGAELFLQFVIAKNK